MSREDESADRRLFGAGPGGGEEVPAQDLPEHARFHLVPDWEHLSEHGIHLVRGD